MIMFLFYIENYRNEEEYKNQLIIKLMVVSIIVILSWQTFIYTSKGFMVGEYVCMVMIHVYTAGDNVQTNWTAHVNQSCINTCMMHMFIKLS